MADSRDLAPEPTPAPATLAGLGLLFAVIGFELGAWGSFTVPVALPGGVPGVAVLVAVVGNVAAAWLAGWAAGVRAVGVAGGLGWFIAIFLAFTSWGPGSLVIPGTIPGQGAAGIWAFLVLGALSWVAGIARQPAPPWARRRESGFTDRPGAPI